MNSLDERCSLIPQSNLRQGLLLLFFAVIMFYLHTVPVYHTIFTDWPGAYGKFVNFSADDAVYHMRLVHNTIHHFPWRILFDPFTHCPFGDKIAFGPLFTLIIATTALIAGLGHPSPELINLVGAYTPPVMGALCLIPLYFIARRLFGKTAAIITTFILTFLPGEFLQRSSLGFTDHHVAEVLFSTLTSALLIHTLEIAKTAPYVFKHLLRYSILTGIAFGIFVLTWPAALMFGTIFLIFLVSMLLVDHFNDNSTTYLLILAGGIYVIPALMVLPYALLNPHLELLGYSLSQPLTLTAMTLIFAICYGGHLACRKNLLIKNLYSLILAMIFCLIGFLIYYYVPSFFTILKNGCKLLFEPTPGMKTVAEVHPSILNQEGNAYSIVHLWSAYFWMLLFAIVGFIHLCYRVYDNAKASEVFLLIWTTIVILAAIAQLRFNYYLAINVAILAGCYCVVPILELLNNLKLKRQVYATIAVSVFFIAFVIITIDPILMLLIDKKMPSGVQINQEQYHAYMWLKKHTPDPQGKTIQKNFDYAAGYYPIPQDINSPYPYPASAYSVMSWWDIGHQLTYIAERIPNTNPYQSGILEKDPTLGAAPFFTTSSEAKAVKNLEMMRSRYVFIDNRFAINIGGGIGIWCNDTQGWNQLKKIRQFKLPSDSNKFARSMLNRLYYNDANGLQHFRLIYESEGNYLLVLRRALVKPQLLPNTMVLPTPNHHTALKEAAKINQSYWANKEKSILAYESRPPVKKIKIFERVKGAVIKGKVPENIQNPTEVKLTLKLKTKFKRIFIYQQTAKIMNGHYQFIVPYPTTAMRGTDYSYDINPMGNYKITIGSQIAEVSVSEKAVMQGTTIQMLTS